MLKCEGSLLIDKAIETCIPLANDETSIGYKATTFKMRREVKGGDD